MHVSLNVDIFQSFFNNKLDPCDKITCNGINAECQIYLGGPKKGNPFCACPDGFRGDPQVRCCKYIYLIINDEKL